MNRRNFSKNIALGGLVGSSLGLSATSKDFWTDGFEEKLKDLPVRDFDVIVAGAGTG